MFVDLALGDDDPFFKDELLTDTATILNDKRVAYNLHRFQGGHVIDPDLLLQIVNAP